MFYCSQTTTETAPCGKNYCCLSCPDREGCEDRCPLEPGCADTCENRYEETEAVAKLETAALEVMKTIKTIAQQKEKLDEADKTARQQLADAMAKYGVKSFENSILKVTYIPASTKTTIDSKKLKDKNPAIYREYSKTSTVKESVRITVK